MKNLAEKLTIVLGASCLLLVGTAGNTIFADEPAQLPGCISPKQSEDNRLEQVGALLAQVSKMQRLPTYALTEITKITTLPLEWHAVAMRASTGKGTNTIDHLEVFNDREGKITCINVFVNKYLEVNAKDVASLKDKHELGTAQRFEKQGASGENIKVLEYKNKNSFVGFYADPKKQERVTMISLYR